ncbi:MAG: hypothetical protein JWL71_4781 [Acidobacteria bacterium]|nr:hypothetical protein [Acidobacteriota bacterium]
MTRSLALAIAVQAAMVAAIGLVVLDMRAHNRVERLGGVNVWGYRGLELGAKRTNEIRIAVFGGDLAFGWGVASDETMASYVARLVSIEMNRSGRRSRLITPIVAAARGMRADEYGGWIRHFRGLQPDIVCVLPDEPGHALDSERFLPDRRSVVFAASGYAPILPLVVREKSAVTHSALLGAAARLLTAADVQVADAADAPADRPDPIGAAIAAARQVATTGVLLVLPPRWADATSGLPAEDRGMRIVRLAGDARMLSPELRLDGYHFSAGGHSRAADTVAPIVLEQLRTGEGAAR